MTLYVIAGFGLLAITATGGILAALIHRDINHHDQ